MLAMLALWLAAALASDGGGSRDVTPDRAEAVGAPEPSTASERRVDRAPHADSHVPHIPEPMVFDLVRGLGAARNELEANVLMFVPLRPGQGTEIGWAPEIEWAPVRGFAVEVELPIVNTTVEALKFAVQGTFPGDSDRVIHGTQWIVEGMLRQPMVETTGLYLLGVKLHPRWSLLAMAGLRAYLPTRPADSDTRVGLSALTNLSVFAEAHERVTLGLETNLARSLEGGAAQLRVVPQVHLGIVRHLRLQVGGGLVSDLAGVAPHVAARVIIER